MLYSIWSLSYCSYIHRSLSDEDLIENKIQQFNLDLLVSRQQDTNVKAVLYLPSLHLESRVLYRDWGSREVECKSLLFLIKPLFRQMSSVETGGKNKRGRGKPEGGTIFIHN